MSDLAADDEVQKVAKWLENAFPGHTCTKCGHDKFYVLEPPPQRLADGPLTYSPFPVTKLACAKCGLIEEHLTGVLKNTLETTSFKPLVKKRVSK